jgi:hypothetical protein
LLGSDHLVEQFAAESLFDGKAFCIGSFRWHASSGRGPVL